MAEYPRVLVVGQPFERASGGGITMSNLFEGWPRDRLANVALGGTDLAGDVCGRFYLLGNSEIRWVWPFSLVPRSETPPSRELVLSPAQERGPGGAEQAGGRALKTLFGQTVDALGARDELCTVSLSEELLGWIRAFRPDVVYSHLHSLPVMHLVAQLADEIDAALVIHMMDDWPSTAYRHGALSSPVQAHMQGLLRSLTGRADSVLAIGDAMATEYSERYGGTWLPLHNPVDLEAWEALVTAHPYEPTDAAEGTLRVVYAGRVGRANTGSVMDVAGVVSEMASDGLPISFQVNTRDTGSPAAAAMAALPGVTVTPAGDYDRVPGLLAAADVLLMPLDFDAEGARLMRLSMPTKVSEYLATGRPVLTYAPRGSAVSEYARDDGWSLVVDERDPAALRSALRVLIDDPAARQAMGARARQVAEEKHDAGPARARFAEALANASHAPRRADR